jgi:hypothetical protein
MQRIATNRVLGVNRNSARNCGDTWPRDAADHLGENVMKTLQELIAIAVGIISALLTGQALAQPVQAARPAQARNVVPVHGACADGSS